MNPVILHKQMHRCFESHYEGIFQIEGASCRPLLAAFKHKFLKEPDDAYSQQMV